MQIKEVMSRRLDRITPDATITEALQKLEETEGEPVAVYEGHRLIGMLTEHDIVQWSSKGGRDPRLTKVRQVMDLDVPLCYEDEDVRKVAREAEDKHAQAIVVLRRDHGGEEAVGTLSPAVLRATASSPEERVEAPREAVQQPIAAPSVLGLFGFAGATLVVGAYMAGWYGSPLSPLYLFPFAAIFGGVAQFLAAMWAFRARDVLATAMHGTWGSFWMAYGIIEALIATGAVAVPRGVFPELGFWFIILGAITWMGALAAIKQNLVWCAHLVTLAVAASLGAWSFMAGAQGIARITGWFFVISAALAWYLASALMTQSTFRRRILPIGPYHSPVPLSTGASV